MEASEWRQGDLGGNYYLSNTSGTPQPPPWRHLFTAISVIGATTRRGCLTVCVQCTYTCENIAEPRLRRVFRCCYAKLGLKWVENAFLDV